MAKEKPTIGDLQIIADELESVLKVIYRISSQDGVSITNKSPVEISDHFGQISSIAKWAAEKALDLSRGLEKLDDSEEDQ